MKLIVISSPVNLKNEIETIIGLFELGLKNFHLRKPNFSREEYEQFLNDIPSQYRQYIIIHHHHQLIKDYQIKGIHHTSKSQFDRSLENSIHQSKSFHSLEEIKNNKYPYKYVFLSPIFKSISKPGYRSKFNFADLEMFLKSRKERTGIIALGGIQGKNVEKTIELGFDGIAILGTIWKKSALETRLENYRTIFVRTLDETSRYFNYKYPTANG